MNWVGKATRRKLLAPEKGEELLTSLKDISFKLNYYIRSLNTSQSNLSKPTFLK